MVAETSFPMAASEPVNRLEEAYEYVGYYMQRWKIERFHYVLKSGCAIEKLQERSIDKTTALILMYSIIAVMILNTTYAARLTPCLPCSLLLGEEEWKLLYCVANKSKKEPKKPYTIKEAVELPGMVGRAETGAQRRASRSQNDMDRADEVIYTAGLPGVPRMILWVKFRALPRGFFISSSLQGLWWYAGLSFFITGRPPPVRLRSGGLRE
jgi:hypothetical protein